VRLLKLCLLRFRQLDCRKELWQLLMSNLIRPPEHIACYNTYSEKLRLTILLRDLDPMEDEYNGDGCYANLPLECVFACYGLETLKNSTILCCLEHISSNRWFLFQLSVSQIYTTYRSHNIFKSCPSSRLPTYIMGDGN
jgi:hypothetical protein